MFILTPKELKLELTKDGNLKIIIKTKEDLEIVIRDSCKPFTLDLDLKDVDINMN